jgi:citrate lyase subunit beta/citryl-CoA lyase
MALTTGPTTNRFPSSAPPVPGGVPADVARSWLLVTAARTDDREAAFSSRADQIVLDLEDGVDASRKDRARDDVVGALTDPRVLAVDPPRIWVRINDRTSPFWSADVDGLKNLPGLAGVMLAKTEAAEDVTETFDRLGGSVRVLALVESALGIEESVAIARARGVFRLAFGSGDYRRDTGTSADDLAMAYPRSRLVVASRIGGLPGPIDGPTVGTAHRVLRERAEVAVSLGMTGKLCLDVGQLPVINETISPAPSDVAWARTFLADFEARDRVVRDGSDLPRLGRAQKIDHLARIFGVGTQ